MDLTGVEVVSWDVDGTLYDLPAMRRRLRQRAMRALLSPRFVTAFRELGQLRRFHRDVQRERERGGDLTGFEPETAPDQRRDVHRRWLGPAIRDVGLREGVTELMALFDEQGLRQVASTDFYADFKLEALELEGRFEQVFVGEELGYVKPSVAYFQHVTEALGVAPGAILHLGDREDTDGAAREAGWRVVIVEPGSASLREFVG
ncbi:MAG: HAD family hydrolase [Planctomycetota bacterium]|jgi:FMN phosphatase YigB (HAD superfamily)